MGREEKTLAHIVVLATGGTIAGSGDSATQMTGYKAGNLHIQTIIKKVPGIEDVAHINAEQIVCIDSKDMTTDILLRLSRRCNELLAEDDVDGLVITHGTDTMEETAYFLHLTVHSSKPVVLTGAMRPATAMGADGPVNLLNALRVAAAMEAAGRGVLVTMNDEIFCARDVMKCNTTLLSAFRVPELGVMGYLTGGKPSFYYTSLRRNTGSSEFGVEGLSQLSRVDIIYSHVDGAPGLIDASVQSGAVGIVYAGTGNGSIHTDDERAIFAALQKGVVVVRCSRTGNGMVVPAEAVWEEHHIINGDTLSPAKARILLQLALTKTKEPCEIQRMFDEY